MARLVYKHSRVFADNLMRMPRPRLKLIVPPVIALALAALSFANIIVAGQGLMRRSEVVDGVPLEIFVPTNANAQLKLPTVLVVHGFSGNKQLMYGFGYALAKNGYAAALIDFAGHGASLDRLPESFAGDVQYQKLASNIDTTLSWLREQSFVDADRLAILGHSMGASAVARYGSTHPDVPVTIALSLGNFGAQLPDDPAKPRNFLIMVGAAEFAGFIEGSTAGLHAAYPQGVAGSTYGDFADDTVRRLFVVPNVEHISILFSHDTYREMVRWLDAAFGIGRDTPVAVDSRIGWVLLLYLAAIIGFYALASILFIPASPPSVNSVFQISGWRVIATSFIAAALAVLALRANLVPYHIVPLTVGNYVGAFFLIDGLVVGTYAWLKRRENVPSHTQSSTHPLSRLFPTLALTAYALVTFALPGHLTWNNFALVGDRAWIAVALFFCCFVFFAADEFIVARASRRARLALYALTKLIVLVALIVAVFALGAPGFLLLLLPVMLVLFVWHGLYSHWLFGLARSPAPAALLNAVVFAWAITATFALVT